MAKIVLGLATSHSPNVSTVPELWALHAERDRRNPNLDFAALVKAAPPHLADQLTPEVFAAKHSTCQRAIDVLSDAWRQSDADLMLVIGDDQRELFLDECSPVFALYSGQELIDIPPAPETVDPSHKPALCGRVMRNTPRPIPPSLSWRVSLSALYVCRALMWPIHRRNLPVAVLAMPILLQGCG
jgi:hypothetical protein